MAVFYIDSISFRRGNRIVVDRRMIRGGGRGGGGYSFSFTFYVDQPSLPCSHLQNLKKIFLSNGALIGQIS